MQLAHSAMAWSRLSGTNSLTHSPIQPLTLSNLAETAQLTSSLWALAALPVSNLLPLSMLMRLTTFRKLDSDKSTKKMELTPAATSLTSLSLQWLVSRSTSSDLDCLKQCGLSSLLFSQTSPGVRLIAAAASVFCLSLATNTACKPSRSK